MTCPFATHFLSSCPNYFDTYFTLRVQVFSIRMYFSPLSDPQKPSSKCPRDLLRGMDAQKAGVMDLIWHSPEAGRAFRARAFRPRGLFNVFWGSGSGEGVKSEGILTHLVGFHHGAIDIGYLLCRRPLFGKSWRFTGARHRRLVNFDKAPRQRQGIHKSNPLGSLGCKLQCANMGV